MAYLTTLFAVVPEVEATDGPIMTPDQLSLLQQNFNALQGKFVSLMTEKADLLEKLQENEHLIVQLSHETETIGDYISVYQAQRDAMKNRFREKDQCIEQLTQERVSMQVGTGTHSTLPYSRKFSLG